MVLSRRNVLTNAGKVASGMIMGSGAFNATAGAEAAKHPAPKLKVIFAGGHPGDPEYGCGGTIARLTELGHEVVLLYMNDGGWPPNSSEVRIAEAKKACEILKARPAYVGQINGKAIVDNDHYASYQNLIAMEKPDGLFTHWPIDNHRDHRAISMLSLDAWKQLDKAFPLYYYEVSSGEDTLQFSPNQYVDIERYESIKRAACYAHATQTPDRYYELQDGVAKFRGIESGYKRAEAFLIQLESPRNIFPL
jgi:LmbE family N-acetylglucosaminyl deacetylase